MTDQNNFRYQRFVAVPVCPGGKVPFVYNFVDNVLSSHEPEICPSTSLVENRVEFEFQTDRNAHVD